ncbi:hypothetical protein [aff. Roholtiella sp. LEGE 12411]
MKIPNFDRIIPIKALEEQIYDEVIKNREIRHKENQAVVDQTVHMFASEAELLEFLPQILPECLGKIHHAGASCSNNLILELIKQILPNKGQAINFSGI